MMNVVVTPGSNNVFADLGFSDPGKHQLKAWIVVRIDRRMKTAGLTLTQAAEGMEPKQSDLSAILHGRFKGYSIERLTHCLSALSGEV